MIKQCFILFKPTKRLLTIYYMHYILITGHSFVCGLSLKLVFYYLLFPTLASFLKNPIKHSYPSVYQFEFACCTLIRFEANSKGRFSNDCEPYMLILSLYLPSPRCFGRLDYCCLGKNSKKGIYKLRQALTVNFITESGKFKRSV